MLFYNKGNKISHNNVRKDVWNDGMQFLHSMTVLQMLKRTINYSSKTLT